MVNWQSRKTGDILLLANGIVLVILINLLSSLYFFRVDLTEENRYSLKESTRALLRELDDVVYVEIFLEGELNSAFQRFQKSIREQLEVFRIYSDNKIQFTFTDPSQAISDKAKNEFMADLAARGIQPIRVIDTQNGQRLEKIIFPGALISYGGFETGVTLLKGNKARTSEEEINQSIEGVEYEVANAIYKLTNTNPKVIGLVSGHGELDSLEAADFNQALSEFYKTERVMLDHSNSLNQYDALIIAKPQLEFPESHKFKIDQYIMAGGKVLFLIDKFRARMDSVSAENYTPAPYDLKLDDLLFKYGVRINYDLVQDLNAALYQVVIGENNGKPRMQLIEWPFFPLLNHYPEHPITRNLDAVLARFVSSIDTVRATGVRKSPLLLTSTYSRTSGAPVNLSINDVLKNTTPEAFSNPHIPVAYLLEGSFTSLYKNRFLPEGAEKEKFREQSSPTKIIVVADGDIARNEINPATGQPQPLGFDRTSNYTFANKELLMNMLTFLTDENGLISARTKSVKIRPLDKTRISTEKSKWQVINIVLPLVMLIIFGVTRGIWRKRKFAQFKNA